MNNELQKICSKSNSFTFYRFPGMHNQVETQKKGSKVPQFMRILAIIAVVGGLRTMSCNEFAPNPILSRSIGTLGCSIK